MATREEIAKLYVATFDRAADAEGLAYWISDGTDATTSLTDLEDLAAAMTDNSEYQELYGDMDREEIVTAMYQNLFDRAPDNDGLEYWTGLDINGDGTVYGDGAGADVSIDKLIIALINGAQGDDAVIMNNKAEVGLAYADAGLNDIEKAKEVIDVVTADPASVEEAKLLVNDVAVQELGQTYDVSTDAASVVEGNSVDFTVSLGYAVSTDTVVNYQIQGVEVAGGTADPIDDLGILNGTVTIPAGETSATISLTPTSDGVTEGYEGFKVVLLDSSFNEIASSNNVVIEDPANAGQTFTLTTGVDSATDFTGGAGDDTFIGVVDADSANSVDNSTWSALDAIDGGDGKDTFNISNIGVDKIDFTIGTISNIETINVQSVIADTVDVSSISGLETVNVTKSAGVTVTAADTTDVNVSGANGAVYVDGGKNVVVTDDTADTNIMVGFDSTGTAAESPSGSVIVTDTKQGTGAITVNGGTDVTVTTTTTTGTTTVADATGAIIVNATAAEVTDDDDTTMGGITVTGGSSVDVTVSAGTTDASKFATGTTITQSAVSVIGDDNTTTVTVTQDAAVAEKLYIAAVEGVYATQTVTFIDMDAGDTVTVNGLSFTAAKDLTAEEVATAFAQIANDDTQAPGGVVENGFYTASSNTADWTAADSADGATLTYTEVTAGGATTGITVSSGVTVSTFSAGTAEVDGVTGVLGVANGSVAIADGGEDSLTTVTIDGYATSTVASDVITSLTLKNNTKDADLTLTTASTGALDLTLDNITSSGAATVTAANITELNLTTEGSASTLELVAADVTNLNITAGVDLDISDTDSDISAVVKAIITGAGAVDLGGEIAAATNIATFDASANTGGVTATIETDATTVADISEYIFSAGDDDITTQDTSGDGSNDIKITAGGGDDTITLATGTQSIAADGSIDAGDGTDTLVMAAADLNVVTANSTFAASISNFEKVTVGDLDSVADTGTAVVSNLDLANLDNINYVNVSGITMTGDGADDDTGDSITLAISNLAANGTINLTNAIVNLDTDDTASLSITLADATGDADVLNLSMTNDAGISNTGLVIANDIETINIESVDTDTTDDTTVSHLLQLSADSATTINITGDANFDFVLTDDAVTLIDASALNGDLVADASNDSETVLGGSGDDLLSATGSQDTLNGGAGDDTLTGGDLTELIGGEGNDIFVMNMPSNVNSYSTITDFSSGDVIDFANGSAFTAGKIVLADTAVFQDYANAAVNENDADGTVTWFQYSGDTYIVVDADNTDTDFQNGVDSIIKIAGLVDLDADASYNLTYGTLELA